MAESFDMIVQNGKVVLRDEIQQLDIGIRDGRIVRLAERIEPDTVDSSLSVKFIDAAGQFVLPGVVDVHVHFNEPGFGSWEGFASGSAALAAGGVTSYVDMPLNGRPPTVNSSAFHQKLEAARGSSYVDYALWGGLVPGNKEELRPLAENGVVGFKAFLSAPGGEGEDVFREVDDLALFEGMKRIAAWGGILALHAESESLTSRLAAKAIREGRSSALDYAATRPVVAELEAVNRALLYARHTGCALHFVHISSEAAIELIDRAKQVGLNITAETCPHYLALTEEDMESLGPVAKCAPPLRSAEEQERLWNALEEGRIDIIASDHSPCPKELKTPQGESFFDAWGGISGAQSTLELMLHEGHVKRGIPITKLVKMLSYQPAVRFGLHPRKGEIAIGADADLAIVDMENGYTLEPDGLYSRHKHSPYVGRAFSCRVLRTLCRGHQVYSVEKGLDALGHGQWLRPERGEKAVSVESTL
ncbi:allantoinase [Paenibacillus sp. UNC451MF]|uniref:allantoinase n=1 Tax=Paenibacillus sp. UNC451MF TaxID=1449063 RepID=UPI0004906091|nr:allantoinase [Paenibacillus sp. UNC451MF]